MFRLPISLVLIAAMAAGLSAACMSGKPGKGDEEQLPIGGKFDSFRRPTEHGELRFAFPSTAEFTADSRFHTWTFAVTGDASVKLATTSSERNMDTVLYLYRKNTVTGLWGSYIRKADDRGDSLLAQLDADLAEGEYRVLVKAYKAQVRGFFTLVGECDGSGCPTGEPGGFVYDWPAPTDFSLGCATRIDSVLRSGAWSSDGYHIEADQISRLDGVERIAAEAFLREEEVDGGIDSFHLRVVTLEDGSLIEVDPGADWSYEYLFDGEELLLGYLNDQSPHMAYYCQAPGEESIDLDDYEEGDCPRAMMRTLPGDTDAMTELEETYTFGEPNDGIPAAATAAIDHYVEDTGMERRGEIAVTYYSWDSYGDDFGAQGGEVTLSADSQPTRTYVVADASGERWLFVAYDADGDAEALCLQS